jgi:hypothetical protein
MKKPSLSFDKGNQFKTILSFRPQIEDGFFTTVPNPLKQLPEKV